MSRKFVKFLTPEHFLIVMEISIPVHIALGGNCRICLCTRNRY